MKEGRLGTWCRKSRIFHSRKSWDLSDLQRFILLNRVFFLQLFPLVHQTSRNSFLTLCLLDSPSVSQCQTLSSFTGSRAGSFYPCLLTSFGLPSVFVHVLRQLFLIFLFAVKKSTYFYFSCGPLLLSINVSRSGIYNKVKQETRVSLYQE